MLHKVLGTSAGFRGGLRGPLEQVAPSSSVLLQWLPHGYGTLNISAVFWYCWQFGVSGAKNIQKAAQSYMGLSWLLWRRVEQHSCLVI